MEIMLNGEKVTCEEGVSLENLLLQMQYDKRQVAAEVNGDIIPKAEYGEHIVKPGDEIEVVTFMGGGCC
jgi:thiamine biosynthesis protein ThiS